VPREVLHRLVESSPVMGAADPCIISLLQCEFQVLLIGG